MSQFWMELAPATMFSATWCTIFVGPFLQESHWPNSTSLNHPRNVPSCSAKIHRFTQIFAQVISPTARRQSKIMQQFLCTLFPRFSFPNHPPELVSWNLGPQNHPITLGIFQKICSSEWPCDLHPPKPAAFLCPAAKVHSDVTSKAAPKRSKFTICSLDHTTPIAGNFTGRTGRFFQTWLNQIDCVKVTCEEHVCLSNWDAPLTEYAINICFDVSSFFRSWQTPNSKMLDIFASQSIPVISSKQYGIWGG